MRPRIVVIAMFVSGAMTLVGCSSSAKKSPASDAAGSTSIASSSTASTPAATSSPPISSSVAVGSPAINAPITDAKAARDTLLRQAATSTIDDQGQVSAWTAADAGLTFAGSGVPADPATISGYQSVTSKSKDLDYLTFAVADSAGGCAAGALELSSDGSKVAKSMPVTLPAGAQCTGSAAGDAGGY